MAGPGFINFFLADQWIGSVVSSVLKAGDNYGRCDLGKGRKVQVEFVSANPTGPLHVGHGRGAAVGDIICNILSFAGWSVQKEYYVNDAGLQMSNLGKSTQSRYFELLGRGSEAPFPDDGYKGDYIYDLARDLIEKEGESLLDRSLEDSLPFFTEYSCGVILEGIKKDLNRFGVKFDRWFSEKTLYTDKLVQNAVSTLNDRGYTYEDGGCGLVSFRPTSATTKTGSSSAQNGCPNLLRVRRGLSQNKFDRGFDRVYRCMGSGSSWLRSKDEGGHRGPRQVIRRLHRGSDTVR